MSKWTKEEQKKIINQFHRYCYNVLQHEAINYLKSRNRRLNSLIYFDDLTDKDLLQNAIYMPEYSDALFHIDNDSIFVQNPDLAESMKKLSPYRLDIILLYYFLDFSEKDIARRFQRSQQAISKQKNIVLTELKESMKEFAAHEN